MDDMPTETEISVSEFMNLIGEYINLDVDASNYDETMQFLEDQGYLWSSGHKPTWSGITQATYQINTITCRPSKRLTYSASHTGDGNKRFYRLVFNYFSAKMFDELMGE